MHPAIFWRTTPRKFNALCKVHVELNSTSKKTKDQSSDKDEDGRIKDANAYVDQIPGM